jgi:hypothetical protein
MSWVAVRPCQGLSLVSKRLSAWTDHLGIARNAKDETRKRFVRLFAIPRKLVAAALTAVRLLFTNRAATELKEGIRHRYTNCCRRDTWRDGASQTLMCPGARNKTIRQRRNLERRAIESSRNDIHFSPTRLSSSRISWTSLSGRCPRLSTAFAAGMR